MEEHGAPRLVAGTALALLVALILVVSTAAAFSPQDAGLDLPITR